MHIKDGFMNSIASRVNHFALSDASRIATSHSSMKRLLNVREVVEWLGVSDGWVRDHAAGRRQPRLQAIKLGSRKGKGLWKFREEDVYQFIRDQRMK